MTLQTNPNIRKSFVNAGFSEEQADKIITFYAKRSITPFERLDITTRLEQLQKLFGYFGKTQQEVNTKMAKYPIILTFVPQTIKENISETAHRLKLSKQEWFELCWTTHSLLERTADSIEKILKNQSAVLNVSEKKWKKEVLKRVNILCLSTHTLNKNAETVSTLLQIPKELWIKTALKDLELFCLSPQSIHKKLHQNSKALNITFQKMIQTFLRNPRLVCFKPEHILKKTTENARALGLSQTQWINACCLAPSLFYMNKETLLDKLKKNAELFETDVTTVTQEFLKIPCYFYMDTKNTEHKMKFLTKMYLKDMFQLNGDKGVKNLKWFKRFLLKNPTCIHSIQNLHLRCTYARYLKFTNQKVGSLPFYQQKYKIEEELAHAPAAFVKNEPIYQRLRQLQKTKENQNG